VYARERAEAEDPTAERTAALARAFGAWLHLAERADARLGSPLLEPVYGTAPRWQVDRRTTERLLADPLAFLEAEGAGLVATVTQAASLGMAGVSWELTSALTQLLATRMYLDEWRRCTAEALTAAPLARDARGEGAMLLSAGILETLRPGGGRHTEALACWQAALGIFQRLGEDTALVHLGRHAEARPLLEPWLDSGFPFLRGWALRALGELDHAEGRHHHARAALGEALRLFCELDMPAEETATLRVLEAVGEPA
jgi:tetratricopeptide (TPR) repeat protein